MRSILQSLLLTTMLFLGSVSSAQAVNIAIIDTGLDPNILGGVLAPGGFDFVNNDNDASDESSNLHGTAVGHVAINSGSKITLTAIKAFQEADSTSSAVLEAAFNYVAGLDNVKVVNFSGASISNTPLSALLAVVNAGKIIVLQAGNFGGSSPAGDAQKVVSLDGKGIVVGGVKADGKSLQSFSNRAGNLAEYYVVARTNSLITSSNGTSMATPRVSAAAATILDQFAFLKPEQVVQLLFNTASDLGEPGIDSTYGHGLLDLQAALTAAGAGSIPPDDGGGGGGGGGGGLGLTALALGGAAAYALLNKDEELQRTVLVDSFGRAFNFNFVDRISVRDSRPNIFSLLESHQTSYDLVPLTSTENSFTQAYVSERAIDPYRFTASDSQSETIVRFLHRAETPMSDYALGLNSDLSTDFGALSLRNKQPDKNPSGYTFNKLFSTPVLGYSSNGTTFTYGWDENKVNHRLGLSVVDDQQDNGQVSNSILYETSSTQERYRLGFQLGALVEDGSFLGGSSDSALGVDQTSTYYLGLNGSYNISDNVTLLGAYFQGMSSVDESNNSLLSSFSNLRTEGYAVGLLVDNLLSNKGSFGLAYSSPLQTTSGSATLTLPVSQNMTTGAIGFESTDVSFSGAGKEKILEAYYNYELNLKNNLFSHLSYTRNPLSNLDAGHESAIYVGWKHRF